MWVHDYVGTNAQIREWHVLLIHNETDHTFLTVSTTKFVAYLGTSRLPHEQLD